MATDRVISGWQIAVHLWNVWTVTEIELPADSLVALMVVHCGFNGGYSWPHTAQLADGTLRWVLNPQTEIHGGTTRAAIDCSFPYCPQSIECRVAQRFKRKGVDSNAQGGDYATPFKRRHGTDIERGGELLAKGADANAQGGYFG